MLIGSWICIALLAIGCSREEEEVRLKDSMARVETRLAEAKVDAQKALEVAAARWDELRPKAEKAIAALENRVEKLINDEEALKHLPPDVLERVRVRIDAMREKLAEAQAAHEQGDTDLAVEKADAVRQERAAVEELLVERPD